MYCRFSQPILIVLYLHMYLFTQYHAFNFNLNSSFSMMAYRKQLNLCTLQICSNYMMFGVRVCVCMICETYRRQPCKLQITTVSCSFVICGLTNCTIYKNALAMPLVNEL